MNRTTVKSDIVGINVPSVTNAELNTMLNEKMNDNLKFLEDTAKIQTSSLSNITVDFNGWDRIDLTRTGGPLNITVAGIKDGEEVSLLITKTTGQPITWSGVTDITPVKDNVTSESVVLYSVINKNSNYYALAWTETVKQATDAVDGVLKTATVSEHNALSVTNKACVPGRLPISADSQKGLIQVASVSEHNALSITNKSVVPGRIPRTSETQSGVSEWADATQAQNEQDTEGADSLVIRPSIMAQYIRENVTQFPTRFALSKNSGWSGTLRYSRDKLGITRLELIAIEYNSGITGASEIGTLPALYAPYERIILPVYSRTSLATIDFTSHALRIDTNGDIDLIGAPDSYTAGKIIEFYASYRS